jgi:hypothetical protein
MPSIVAKCIMLARFGEDGRYMQAEKAFDVPSLSYFENFSLGIWRTTRVPSLATNVLSTFLLSKLTLR